MSSEWQRVEIGQLAKLRSGFPFKSADWKDSGVPVIKIANVKEGRIVPDGCGFVSTDVASKSAEWFTRTGDVLIAMTGYVGEVARVKPGERYLINQRVGRFDFTPNADVEPAFFFYHLQHPDTRAEIEGVARGSAQPNLSAGDAHKIKITLPPLTVQREIAATLSSLDDRITLLRETNATLEAIAQALFKSWFVDFDPVRAKMEGRAPEDMDEATAALFPDAFEETELGVVPKGWGVARLGDVTERITKGTTPTTLKRAFVSSGINFVKAESMTGNGGFIPEKFAFIDEETHALLKRSQLQEDDILISIAGTIGRVAVMSEDFLPANTNQAVALIRPLADIFPGGLVNRFLRLGDSQQKMNEKVVQAVQANLSLGTLSDLQVVVPPAPVARELYDSGLAQLDASWRANDQRARTLSTLRDTLLPRLISGALSIAE